MSPQRSDSIRSSSSSSEKSRSSSGSNSSTCSSSSRRCDSRTVALQFGVPAVSGVVATVLTHPIDTYAIHRMTGRAIESFRIPVLYRGVVPAVGQAVFIYGAMLGTYEMMRSLDFSVVSAATLSAFPESLVKGPLEIIKNRRQTKKRWPQKMSSRLRLLGLGTFGMLCREMPGNIAYFQAYEWARHRNYSPMFAGAIAGAAFTAIAYPIDAMRAQYVTGTSLKNVYPTFRGVQPYLFRAVAVTSILFGSFEFIASQAGLQTVHGHAGSRGGA